MTRELEIIEKLGDVIRSKTNDFSHLFELSGLRKDQDFRAGDWRGVDFGKADLSGFDFSEADLTDANFGLALGLGEANFHKAIGLERATWPAGFDYRENRSQPSSQHLDAAEDGAPPKEKGALSLDAHSGVPEITPDAREPYVRGAFPLFPIVGQSYSQDFALALGNSGRPVFGVDNEGGDWLAVSRHRSVKRWLKEGGLRGVYAYVDAADIYQRVIPAAAAAELGGVDIYQISDLDIERIESGYGVSFLSAAAYLQILHDMGERTQDLGIEGYLYSLSFIPPEFMEAGSAFRTMRGRQLAFPELWEARVRDGRSLSYRQAALFIELAAKIGVNPLPQIVADFSR